MEESLLLILVLASVGVRHVECSFGEPLDDTVVDERFRKVGKAYVQQFDISDNTLDLHIKTEDTIGVHEIWVVDFEPYNIIPNVTVIDMETGDVLPENSGECSNIINGGTFVQETLENGVLFDDENNITPVQFTTMALEDSAPKKLFTTYSRDEAFDTIDVYNETVTRRAYNYQFLGDFGFLFNCTNRLGESIWSYSDTENLIEFKATVYFTNVRPVDNTDGTQGMSFVSSSANLYYRIYRVAMINFIVSSEPLVAPKIDFVIISPYVPADALMALPNAAHLRIRFRTTIESPDGQLLIFEPGTIEYEPMDNNNSLNTDFSIIFPSGPQPCERQGVCEQLWDFQLVLNVRERIEGSGGPVDATGVFKFQFTKHTCSDVITSPSNCVDLNEPALTISMEITIQTVVTVVDSETDEPQIVVVSLTGLENENLIQNGGEVRGVNHLEKVKYRVRYTPAFLYDTYKLMLTLFMVCRGETWENEPEGCLAATVENRYIAYYHEDFEFTYTNQEASKVTYGTNSLEEDAWDPDGDNSTQQVLTFNGADPTNENHYRMDFVNTALSNERDNYVITTVFKLVSKERKRREISYDQLEETTLIFNTVSAELNHSIEKRSIEDTIDDQTGLMVPFEFTGCPTNARFVADRLDCECVNINEQYSDKTFQCETVYNIQLFDETEDDVFESAAIAQTANLLGLATLLTAIIIM